MAKFALGLALALLALIVLIGSSPKLGHLVEGLFSVGEKVIGSGVVAKRFEEVPAGLDIIRLNVGDSEVTVGGKPGVEIEADDNILPLISINPDGDRLIIDNQGSYTTSNPIRIRVGISDLKRMELGGAASAKLGEWKRKDGELSIEGAARVTIDRIQLESLSAGMNGAAQLMLGQGTIGLLKLKANGSVRAGGGETAVKVATIEVDGASSADFAVSDELSASAHGASTIKYSGDPKMTQRSTSGASTIRKH
jgi:hypothetical protein